MNEGTNSSDHGHDESPLARLDIADLEAARTALSAYAAGLEKALPSFGIKTGARSELMAHLIRVDTVRGAILMHMRAEARKNNARGRLSEIYRQEILKHFTEQQRQQNANDNEDDNADDREVGGTGE